MKPFNLEAFKAGKPAVTKDKRTGRFLGILDQNTRYPLVVAIQFSHGEEARLYTLDGRHSFVAGKESNDDLFMPSEKKEGWYCLHPNFLSDSYSKCLSEEEANTIAEERRLVPVHITWKE